MKVHKDDIIKWIVTSGQKSLHDYGDTEYLYDKGMPHPSYT